MGSWRQTLGGGRGEAREGQGRANGGSRGGRGRCRAASEPGHLPGSRGPGFTGSQWGAKEGGEEGHLRGLPGVMEQTRASTVACVDTVLAVVTELTVV